MKMIVTWESHTRQLIDEALAVLPDRDAFVGTDVQIGPVTATVTAIDPESGMVRLQHKNQRAQDVTLVLFADAWKVGAVVPAGPQVPAAKVARAARSLRRRA